MLKATLTDLSIRNAMPVSGKQINLHDDRLAGFGIRISAGGTKTFFLRYRFKRHERIASLGKYPLVSLSEAHSAARSILGQAEQGLDPNITNRVLSRQPLFGAVLDEFIAKHVKVNNKPSTQREHERVLRKDFWPHWKHREITDITKRDVMDVLDMLLEKNGPSAANHGHANITTLFNWALARNLIPFSPCHGLPNPAATNECDTVLTDDELRAVWKTAGAHGYPFGSIVQLLMLTGQRRSEVAQMRWQDLNLDENFWSIPREHTKNNRPHLVRLLPPTIEIINAIPRLNDTNMFPSRRTPDRCFSGFSKSKRRLDTDANVHGWTLRDLRRTVSTNMARLGVLQEFIDRSLNQLTGSTTKVNRIYNRYQYRDEKIDALNRWTAHLVHVTRTNLEQ